MMFGLELIEFSEALFISMIYDTTLETRSPSGLKKRGTRACAGADIACIASEANSIFQDLRHAL